MHVTRSSVLDTRTIVKNVCVGLFVNNEKVTSDAAWVSLLLSFLVGALGCKIFCTLPPFGRGSIRMDLFTFGGIDHRVYRDVFHFSVLTVSTLHTTLVDR